MSIRTRELIKFIINLVFALYSFVLGIASYSWWFIATGAYHLVLGIMRIAVIAFSAKTRKNEMFIMRFSGVMIFALSVVLCGIVYMTVNSLGAVKYHEIAMITIATFAFAKLTLGISEFIKNRRNHKSCIATISSISLTDAVVSIYSLQRSMLVSFEGMSHENIVFFNTLSGIGMCIIAVCTGIYLIIRKEDSDGKIKNC